MASIVRSRSVTNRKTDGRTRVIHCIFPSFVLIPRLGLWQDANRSPLQGEQFGAIYPGLKPWTVLLYHFVVEAIT